jgi:two-component SAPR family response regulator
MPGGLNGWDLAQRAVDLRPGIKVLFTSGYALETLAAHGRTLNGFIILMKPYRKADLALRIQQALAHTVAG